MNVEDCVPVTELRLELGAGAMRECPLCGWAVSGDAAVLVRTPHERLVFHLRCLADLHAKIGTFWYQGHWRGSIEVGS